MKNGSSPLPYRVLSLFVQEKREIYLFARRFCLFASVGLGLVFTLSRANLIEPFITMLTVLVGQSLELFTGLPIDIHGHSIVLPGIFGIHIVEECVQAEEWVVFLSAVMAYPTSIWSRLVGVALISTTVLLGNTVRIVTLFWAGMQGVELFNVLHVSVWPAATYFGLVLLWILWLRFSVFPYGSWKTHC